MPSHRPPCHACPCQQPLLILTALWMPLPGVGWILSTSGFEVLVVGLKLCCGLLML